MTLGSGKGLFAHLLFAFDPYPRMYRDLQAGPKFPILRYENPLGSLRNHRKYQAHKKRIGYYVDGTRWERPEMEWRDHKLAWADVQYSTK